MNVIKIAEMAGAWETVQDVLMKMRMTAHATMTVRNYVLIAWNAKSRRIPAWREDGVQQMMILSSVGINAIV